MADLATEPRWPRANGTFGEDAKLSAMDRKFHILGFQGDGVGFNQCRLYDQALLRGRTSEGRTGFPL